MIDDVAIWVTALLLHLQAGVQFCHYVDGKWCLRDGKIAASVGLQVNHVLRININIDHVTLSREYAEGCLWLVESTPFGDHVSLWLHWEFSLYRCVEQYGRSFMIACIKRDLMPTEHHDAISSL